AHDNGERLRQFDAERIAGALVEPEAGRALPLDLDKCRLVGAGQDTQDSNQQQRDAWASHVFLKRRCRRRKNRTSASRWPPSVDTSTRSTPAERDNCRSRSPPPRACCANALRTRARLVSISTYWPVSASSSWSRPTFGSSSSRGSRIGTAIRS